MKLTSQIADHFRQVHFGGNWATSNLRDQLSDMTWEQATTQVQSFHTIATLVYHLNYYVDAVLNVLQGGALKANDRFSFDCPPIESEQDWQELLDKTWADAENFASCVEQLPDSALWENMANAKYGHYHRNIHGIIEHCHYHLGQIVVLKKMIREATPGFA